MSNLNTNFDNDFDSFLNLETNDFTPIVSPATRSVPSLSHQHSQQSFSGPSYQYDSHRQQTGLPVGGLANVLAVNQASGMHYRPNSMGYVMPTETLNIPLASNLDDFDYNRNHSMDMNDMDFDADSPSDISSMFYSGGGESSQAAPVQRIYPGMHSQQAAQAKAAQALKQQEVMKQRQQKQLSGQQPLPTQAPKAPAAKDPHVEESISRLLQRMRQSSSASADDDNASAILGMNGMSKLKKEEDDMDEDERLLASEEGKKLSSKERRQLRNKVSARAFRSRRKEYISQMEAEVQQKVQEANDLRVQNRQLMEENTRLTDLTRMLLSSQAFSGFLQELSNSGVSAPQINAAVNSQSNRSSQVPKDIGAHDAARQLQSQNPPQVNMAMIPDNSNSMSGLENWNAIPSNDFHVFAVTALPRPLGLDLGAMMEKNTPVDAPIKQTLNLSTLPLKSERTHESQTTETPVDGSVDLDQELFGLYYNSSALASVPASSAQSLLNSLHKPEENNNGQTYSTASDASTSWLQLQQSCDALEAFWERVANFIPRMG